MNSRSKIKQKVIQRLSKGSSTWLEDLANSYSDNEEHAKRILSYFNREWFFVSSPIAANLIKTGEKFTGCPISCYLISANKDPNKWHELEDECIYISQSGGGIGIDFSDCYFDGLIDKIRDLGTKINSISNITRYKSSMAVYLRVDHPCIENFVHMRDMKQYEDPKRFIHHAVTITDEFMNAAIKDEKWSLYDENRNVIKTLPSARNLLVDILSMRAQSGEPYLFFIDNANKNSPECYKKLNLPIKTSNLCTEICLPTNDELTAICCLCSVNVLNYDEWNGNRQFIEDIVRYMDNVITYFVVEGPRRKLDDVMQYDSKYIANSLRGQEAAAVKFAEEINHPLRKCFRAAHYGRDIGIGSCGNSSYFQKLGIPMESPEAFAICEEIEQFLKSSIDEANVKLAKERGACPAGQKAGVMCRMVNTRAIAPTTMISQFLRCSPCIEPAENVCRVKNGYFVATEFNEQLRDKLGDNDSPEVWIQLSKGKHDVLSQFDINPDVFKDPLATNMEAYIRMTAIRQKYIDQSISLNLFYPLSTTMETLIRHVIIAWKLNIKTFYYMRSQAAMAAAETVREDVCVNCQ